MVEILENDVLAVEASHSPNFPFLKPSQEIHSGWQSIGSIVESRDLGVKAHSSLKVETQIDRVVKKPQGMLL